ncbi:MAG: hypothetical protein R2695_05705 [Acidimicrobiales bacterium]
MSSPPHRLSARSVVASTLLGTVPPRLPGRLLVAFAEEFDINPGTTRVALSRMVDQGELRRDDEGTYELAGPLLARRHRQDAGLAPRTRRWAGLWDTLIVRRGAGRRPTVRCCGRRPAASASVSCATVCGCGRRTSIPIACPRSGRWSMRRPTGSRPRRSDRHRLRTWSRRCSTSRGGPWRRRRSRPAWPAEPRR